MDENVNSIISDNIKEKFGKLSCTTGKKHTFLTLEMKFIGSKNVAVSIPHHNDEALEDFGETLKGNVVNPATSQIFTITSEAKELGDEKKEALSLDNRQNLVDHEVFIGRLGNSGVFSMHYGTVTNRGRLGET